MQIGDLNQGGDLAPNGNYSRLPLDDSKMNEMDDTSHFLWEKEKKLLAISK